MKRRPQGSKDPDIIASEVALRRAARRALQIGLEKYPGTLVFISHDRDFVGSLATRIIELRSGGGMTDFRGTYDEYLKSQGIDP